MTDFIKRDFTQEERDALAAKGHALPDGSFPIVTVEDLHNAISAYGRASNPTEAKQHIISRARALDAVEQLPEKWNVSKVKVKATDFADALGITNEPNKLHEDHVGKIDEMHDAIKATKEDIQNKNNYSASAHLSTAQKHLKDAKAVLSTNALNPDTKHVLAKSSLLKASNALTHATRAAGGSDKNIIHDHNKSIKEFAANPPAKFSKMNENHDEKGRFASGDGASSGKGTVVNPTYLRQLSDSAAKRYAAAYTAGRTGGAPSLDNMDLAQVHEDGQNRLGDALSSLKSGDVAGARSSLNEAAKAFDGHPAFASDAANARGAARDLGNVKKSLNDSFTLDDLDFVKFNENHDEKGRFAAGDSIAATAAGLSSHADARAQQFADHYKATNDTQAFHAANKMAMAKIYADAAQKAASEGNLKDAAANLANAHQTVYSAAQNLERSSNADTNRLSERLTQPYGRAQAEAQSLVTQHNAW